MDAFQITFVTIAVAVSGVGLMMHLVAGAALFRTLRTALSHTLRGGGAA
ncbi:MAG TPA: hypothetical protein VFN74_23670 [Chloroflexota bacterium]|jgi:hypothetical protein|nr:hypothetical protein [Chloroflexota bacterium]